MKLRLSGIVQTGTKIKDGVESIKEPIKEVENTASTGYNKIKKNYEVIKNAIKDRYKEVNEKYGNNLENNSGIISSLA